MHNFDPISIIYNSLRPVCSAHHPAVELNCNALLGQMKFPEQPVHVYLVCDLTNFAVEMNIDHVLMIPTARAFGISKGGALDIECTALTNTTCKMFIPA